VAFDEGLRHGSEKYCAGEKRGGLLEIWWRWGTSNNAMFSVNPAAK